MLAEMNKDYKQILDENKRLQSELKKWALAIEDKKDDPLKEELGDRYWELGPMIEDAKTNLKRIADDTRKSQPLPVRIQHAYQYSKWDSIHEPYNVVENVLRDDEAEYKASNACLDLTLSGGQHCFISEIYLHSNDSGPGTVEIFTSNVPDRWDLVEAYECSKDEIQWLSMPGE